MSVQLVVDMNLSPDWVPVLQRHGWKAVHYALKMSCQATWRIS